MIRLRWMVWVLLLLLAFAPLFELAGDAVHHHSAGKHGSSRGPLGHAPGVFGPVAFSPSLPLIGSVPLASLIGPLPLVSTSPFVPPRA